MSGNMMEGWDLVAVVIRGDKGMEELKSILDDGFEPFSVTHWMEMPPKPAIATVQPQPMMVEKIWLRRKHLIEVAEKPVKA